jgi:hypothetical protein
MKLVPRREIPPLDPTALGGAVLLFAEAGQAGVRVTIFCDRVEVLCDAAHLSEHLAGRLREQRQAILEVGRAVLAARNAGHGPGARDSGPSTADELVGELADGHPF